MSGATVTVPTEKTPIPEKTPSPAANVKLSFVRVTPEVATRWLGTNKANRNIRQAVVAAYARDMKAGRWHLTGEAIKFNEHGELLDGQHRLLAIIQSGVPVYLPVFRGINPEARDVMDTGARRHPSDMFTLSGVKNATIVASAARLMLTLEEGTRRNARSNYTHSEIRACVDANPDVQEASVQASSLSKYIEIPPSVIAVAWLNLARLDEDECAEFFDALRNNTTDGPGDPRLALIRRIANARKGNERVSQMDWLSIIYRAWNARRRGERLMRMPLRVQVEGGGSVGPRAVPKPI